MGPETHPPVARPPGTRRAPHRRFFPVSEPDRRGLYPGEPENCRRDLRAFLAIWGHLALLLAVMKVYRVEGRALFLLTSIALAALPVHYLLAYRWKKPFFLGVSVVGLFAVFGVGPAAWWSRRLAMALIVRSPAADRLVRAGAAIIGDGDDQAAGSPEPRRRRGLRPRSSGRSSARC